ncbi:C39 family peptidase [Candidatus Falkowbacteria bacterium]|nr:C39 family peptidase [Candidatus Falkowbacteria bacterium]
MISSADVERYVLKFSDVREKDLTPIVVIQHFNNENKKSVNLNVPFASQAPFGDWGLPYQEACEEAALIMANFYFRGQALSKEIMDSEIKRLVDFEKQEFGLYSDTTLEEMRQIAVKYFGLKAEISDNVSVDNIKQQVMAGNLVLAPTAGRELANPYFKQPGPLYHFLVIRGYDEKYFITNDAGTRRGEEYKYKYKIVINAIHDLALKTDGAFFRPFEENVSDDEKEAMMLKGEKKILIVSLK